MKLWSQCVLALTIAGCSDAPAPPSIDPPAAQPDPTAQPENSPFARSAQDGGPPTRPDGTVYGTSELMGTTVSINVFVEEGKTNIAAGKAMQAALDEMARIEDIMSEWRATSEVSKLNRGAGGPAVAVSDELFYVLAASKEISKASKGAFDVTFHGVGQLWEFTADAVPPTRAAVKAKLPLVDWRKLKLDKKPQTAKLAKAGMMVGLGAIAKGYAVDRASSVLTEQGFGNHVVEAGGDTFASGKKRDKPWQVGVQNPEGRGSIGVLSVSGRAVVTSGDYQRFFEHEGKRYAHILNPKTGWPVLSERSPKSVTVVASNATNADAYCTAVAVMGPDKGMKFVESIDGLDAVIIDHENKVLVSTGLKDIYKPFPRTPPM